MKKIIAAFAASAVAVSMLAFTGCGESENKKPVAGENFEEKTPEQITEIVDNIDTDKIFGDDGTDDALNMGIKGNLKGAFNMGALTSASGSIVFDFKESADVGAGTATLNAIYRTPTMKEAAGIDVNGALYSDSSWVYASASGTIAGIETGANGLKAKVNLEDLAKALENLDPDIGGIGGSSPASYYEAENAVDVSQMLALAQKLGVKISVDNTDGVKFKLSVTEETIWTALSTVSSEGGELTSEQIAAIKAAVKFNAFAFDVYFSLDADGKFAGARADMDIDVSFPASLISDTLAEQESVPVSVKLKGNIELYVHTETVEIPAEVKTDATYTDQTQYLIGLIGSLGGNM